MRVIVGKENEGQKTLSVHEGIICTRSRFFHNAMKREWRQSEAKVVRMPDDVPDIFELYIILLYTNTIPIEQDSQLPKLLDLYLLADKVIDIKSKNLIMKAILGRIAENKFFPASAINTLYRSTTSNSPARRLIVDCFVKYENEEHIPEDGEELPHEFLVSVTRGLIQKRIGDGHLKYPYERPDVYMELEDESL